MGGWGGGGMLLHSFPVENLRRLAGSQPSTTGNQPQRTNDHRGLVVHRGFDRESGSDRGRQASIGEKGAEGWGGGGLERGSGFGFGVAVSKPVFPQPLCEAARLDIPENAVVVP